MGNELRIHVFILFVCRTWKNANVKIYESVMNLEIMWTHA